MRQPGADLVHEEINTDLGLLKLAEPTTKRVRFSVETSQDSKQRVSPHRRRTLRAVSCDLFS